MSITPKDEAVALARLNLEQIAERYVREVESKLMIWDGVGVIQVVIDEKDHAIGPLLMERYKQAGWSADFTRMAGAGRDYYLRLR